MNAIYNKAIVLSVPNNKNYDQAKLSYNNLRNLNKLDFNANNNKDTELDLNLNNTKLETNTGFNILNNFDITNFVYYGRLTNIVDTFHSLKLSNYKDIIKDFIDKSTNKDGMSILHISTYLGFHNIFLYILTYFPNYYNLDINGRNFLHILCYKGETKTLQIFINWKRYISKMNSINNIFNINKSHGFSKMDIVKGKLSKGINLTETNIKRFESLQIKLKEEALRLIYDNLNIFNTLLSCLDKEGRTPLHYAAMNKFTLCYEVVNIIIDYEFFDLNGWNDVFLKLFNSIQLLEIKPERIFDPRKCLRIEKEMQNLLGDDIIKELKLLFTSKKKEIIKLLINKKDNQGDSVLHIASFHGNFKIVNKLLQAGADINAKNNHDKIPVDLAKDNMVRDVLSSLNKAAKNCDFKSIEELVNFGHNVNDKETIFSQAPLHKIIETEESKNNNKYDVLKKLLDMGSDPLIKDSNGWNSLHYACQYGDYKSVEILINYTKYNTISTINKNDFNNITNDNENINEISFFIDTFSNNGRTPLHFAANNNYPNIVNYLLQNDADLNYKDHYGCTPLHLAAKQGNVECINILLAYRCDLYALDFRSWNILHYASFNGHKSSIRFICKYDADKEILINQRNSQNKLAIEIIKTPEIKRCFTTLWSSSKEGNLDNIRQLIINEGENVNEQTSFNQFTPLHFAVLNNHYLAVKLLLELKADSYLINKEGINSLEYAEVINNSILDMASFTKDNDLVNLKDVTRNILNVKESLLDIIISKSNNRVRYRNLKDFSIKIRKIINPQKKF